MRCRFGTGANLDEVHSFMAHEGARTRAGSKNSERVPVEDAAALRAYLNDRVKRYCPPWMRDQVDDIVQVAWLRVTETSTRIEGDRALGASYLARVAYTVTVDEIRRRRRRREVPMGEAHEALPSRKVDPVQAAGASEIGDAIEDCLAGLLPNRRYAVALYLQGHNVPETGALLGWVRKRAENMVFRGLADLRHCLARKGITP
jgi:RNA polymerase sigma-70 factor (ECF subfamily)